MIRTKRRKNQNDVDDDEEDFEGDDDDEEEEDNNEEDIDYADVFGEDGELVPMEIVKDDLVPLDQATGIDCTLTGEDYSNSQTLNAVKQMCTVLALALFVRHGEVLRENELFFGQQDEKEHENCSKKAPVFHL